MRSRASERSGGLGLPKIDAEFTGMAEPDLLPRGVRLIREEDVLLLHFGHDLGILLNFTMQNAFAAYDLSHPNEPWRRTIEADYCVPDFHVTLKAIEPLATLHDESLRLGLLRVRVLQHIVNRVSRPVQFSRLINCWKKRWRIAGNY